MKKIIFIGSHLGYAMERTPLGGGAMVALELVRRWQQAVKEGGFELTALGSGKVSPHPEADYVRLGGKAGGSDAGLVKLSELQYARFCREFETATTQWVLSRRDRFDPKDTCVIVNDISEGPTLAALAERGYPIVSLWHVDVVDYFNKLYLRGLIKPERLTRLYEGSRRFGGKGLLPDVLRLVFEKQRETVAHSRRMILPSTMMAETVERCYRAVATGDGDFANRAVVVPWGVWQRDFSEEEVAQGAARLREHFQIKPDSLVLMTLSRISPEKGLHLLLKALKIIEKKGVFARKDVCLFMCGEPAFMQGASYWKRVKAEAAQLKKIRIFFPGYLAAPEKRMYFRLARLFISPSIHESYGLNIVEAMQAGLAVLTSDHYGVRDLDLAGFGERVRYPSLAQAPALLAEKLEMLLKDPENLKAMGKAAKARAATMPFSAAADTVLNTALELL